MKRKTFFILIISLTAHLLLNAQTLVEVVEFANQEFKKGNYTIASKEYNRAFFFGYEKKDELSLQIAHCYAQMNDLDLASDFYNKAFRLSNNDSLKDEAILNNAFVLLLQEKQAQALNELFNLSGSAQLEQQIQYHFLKGIAYYGLYNDSTALDEFVQSIQLQAHGQLAEITLQEEFKKVFHYHKRYNPQRSYVMSGILPGSGQLSVGAIQEGVNSMLLIGGLYLIAVGIMQNYSFWDAAIALFPWIQRYYLGGMDKAKTLAISKIETKRYESYLKIIELTMPDSFEEQ
ncbi:MAG: hypothetical protein ACERKD_16560 [Prolixibacteraceae bacterium]